MRELILMILSGAGTGLAMASGMLFYGARSTGDRATALGLLLVAVILFTVAFAAIWPAS